MLTLKQVNEELKKYDAELVRGDGYFYFVGDTADYFTEQGVYVNKLNDLTMDQWVKEYQLKAMEVR